jgi:hypothetical protein
MFRTVPVQVHVNLPDKKAIAIPDEEDGDGGDGGDGPGVEEALEIAEIKADISDPVIGKVTNLDMKLCSISFEFMLPIIYPLVTKTVSRLSLKHLKFDNAGNRMCPGNRNIDGCEKCAESFVHNYTLSYEEAEIIVKGMEGKEDADAENDACGDKPDPEPDLPFCPLRNMGAAVAVQNFLYQSMSGRSGWYSVVTTTPPPVRYSVYDGHDLAILWDARKSDLKLLNGAKQRAVNSFGKSNGGGVDLVGA